MIPKRIEVVNFGAIPYASVDLVDTTLAAVVGKNGAGKSTTFTIAPCFALFGTTKNGCSADDMVRTGQQECAVTFEFEHRGDTYRVTRTRSVKGKGKSTLEMQRLTNGQWVSESGTTIKETEDKIKALLNLDAETFMASSMIMQGRANEFTSKPAGQRKAILSQVLGLEIYDKLQEKAREGERSVNVELEKLKSKVADLAEKTKALPQLKEQLAENQANVKALEHVIAVKESELEQTEKECGELRVANDKVLELQKRIKELEDQIHAHKVDIATHKGKLDRAEKVLAAKDQILEKTKEYEDAKHLITVLETKKPRLDELTKEGQRLEGELHKLYSQRLKLTGRISQLETALANKAELEQAIAKYRETIAELEAMEELESKWKGLDLKVGEVMAAWSKADVEVRAKSNVLDNQIKELERKVAMLADSGCLDADKASCKFLADAQGAKARLIEVNKEKEQLDWDAVTQLKSRYEQLVAEQEALKYYPVEHLRLKELAAELRAKAQLAAELSGKAELLQTLQEQDKQLDNQIKQINGQTAAMVEEAISLREELKPLPELVAKLPGLKQWADTKEQLPAALTVHQESIMAINRLETEIRSKQEKIIDIGLEKSSLSLAALQLEQMEQKLVSFKNELRKQQELLNVIHGQMGAIKAQIASLEEEEYARKRLALDIEPLAKQLVRWQTLIKAFGRNGIPALIIENAVPELERISNEILGQMSNGKHSLRFDTQRELKSRSGMAETLDIIVGDWAGERPYETFSGGEQLRIDFAIRFALAELLARRAGNKIEWLVVDEGLGSQDQEHRGLVLEAIKSVANRFKVVNVITHIEQAQSHFDQIVYFEPKADGVNIRIA